MLEINNKSILKVALPMMLSGFIQSILNMTDGAFLARYSSDAYQAAGGAGIWYITLFMVFIGFNDGAQIRMASKIGENDKIGFSAIFKSNFILLFFTALLLFVIIHFFMPSLITWMVDKNISLAKNQVTFLRLRSFAFFSSMISLGLQASFLALGKTRYVLFASIITASSNILLDYLLIFGKFGLPELGMEGAAIATTISEYFGMFFLLFIFWKVKPLQEWLLVKKVIFFSREIYENFKIGAPLMLQGLVALLVWAVFFVWVEQMGPKSLSVSLNIRYLYFLAFVPIWGYAGTTKTYVSQYVGANQFDKIRIIQRKIQFLTICSLLIVFHGVIFYPETLVSIITDKPDEIQKSAEILFFVSGSILIYGVSSVYFQTLSGIGKTRLVLYVEAFSTSLYIFCAYLFIKILNWDITYVWSVEYVYFSTMGISSFVLLKVHQSKIQKI